MLSKFAATGGIAPSGRGELWFRTEACFTMPDPKDKISTGWRSLLGGRLPLETETAVFILVNALDTFLTMLLMLYVGGHHEGNPVARYFFDHWGFRGLIYYKMAMVAFVCIIAQIIARRNVKTARRLLYFLTAIVAAVVAYSLLLLSRAL